MINVPISNFIKFGGRKKEKPFPFGLEVLWVVSMRSETVHLKKEEKEGRERV